MNVLITTTKKNHIYLVADGRERISGFLANMDCNRNAEDDGWVAIDPEWDTVGIGETELEARAAALGLEVVEGPIVVRERKGATWERPQVLLEMEATQAACDDRNADDDGFVYRLAGK